MPLALYAQGLGVACVGATLRNSLGHVPLFIRDIGLASDPPALNSVPEPDGGAGAGLGTGAGVGLGGGLGLGVVEPPPLHRGFDSRTLGCCTQRRLRLPPK